MGRKPREFLQKLEEEKEAHPEKALILKMFLLLLTIMAAKALFKPHFSALLILFAVCYFLCRLAKGLSSDIGVMHFLAQNFTFIFAPYVEGKDSHKELPIGTYSLILLNVLVFYMFNSDDAQYFIDENLLFLPNSPNLINVPISLVAHIFIHADASHLWGNMIFLWAVGTVIERRIGCEEFLRCYFKTGICASLASNLVYHLFNDEIVHGYGASGAISGLMGIYLIRCYFRTMAVPIPLAGFLPIHVKIRMNSFALMGLFFAINLSSGFGQMLGVKDIQTDYWAHIVGFTVGILLAKKMGLFDPAVEERHLELGMKSWNNGAWNEQALEQGLTTPHGIKHLNIALKINPKNPETLLHLARLISRHRATEAGQNYYHKVIELLARNNPEEALEVFREYRTKYRDNLEIAPATRYRLAEVLYRQGNIDPAERMMEMIMSDASATLELREKAMYRAVKMLEEMNLTRATKKMFLKFSSAFPQSPRLDQLRTVVATV